MGFFDKAKELGSVALEKGKDLAQITKLNIDITSLETKISDSKKIIGDLIVSKKIDVDDADVKKELKNIKQYNSEINDRKEEIAEIEEKMKNKE